MFNGRIVYLALLFLSVGNTEEPKKKKAEGKKERKKRGIIMHVFG